MKKIMAVLIGTSVLISMAASAKVVRVKPVSGVSRSFYMDEAAVMRHVPADYATVQSAIDDASDGDTVLLANGTYMGAGNRNINFNGKKITVTSENGPENCVIDCENQGRGFIFWSWEKSTSILNGVTIQRANALDRTGGGVLIQGSSPLITNCKFLLCESRDEGSEMSIEGSSAEIRDCVFDQHLSDGSSAVSIYSSSSVTMTNCEFTRIQGQRSLYIVGSDALFTDCRIADNTSAGVSMQNSRPIFKGCEISNNFSYSWGGGIQIESFSYPEFIDCVISNNVSDSHGGGCYIDHYSQPKFINCIFTGNQSNGRGGAVYSVRSSLVMINSLVFNNTGSTGGGILLYEYGHLYLADSTIADNVGAIPDTDGAGLSILGDATVKIENSIFWGNNPGQISVGAVDVTYCDVQDGYPGTANIDDDPLFTSGPNGAYYLGQIASGQSANSPCLDTGKSPAEDTCHQLPRMAEAYCMNQFSTRTDETLDSGQVDIGFHYYPTDIPPPTPAPTSTPAPTATPDVPTDGTFELVLEDTYLQAGDEFYLHYTLTNTSTAQWTADVYVVLELEGTFFCYPSWSNLYENFDHRADVAVNPGAAYTEDVLRFPWPSDITGPVTDLYFYGVVMHADTVDIIGDPQIITWGYE